MSRITEETVKMVLRGIRNRGIRSWLTMIGIVIGITVIVSLISLGQGLQSAVEEQFKSLGTDLIIITPGAGFFSFGGAGASLTTDDLDVVRSVRGVEIADGMLMKLAKVRTNGEVKYTWVAGVPQGETKELIETSQTFEIEKGRDLKEGDRYKAVVGQRVHEGEIFKRKIGVGSTIYIEDREFKVVGILESIGNPDDDNSIVIPLDTARELFDAPDEMSFIMARAKEGAEIQDVAEKIKKELRKERGLEEGEEDFTVQTYEDLKETASSVLGLIEVVLLGIGGISLIVGGIGIMNTMYTSVLERRREIGIMKAVGATNLDVLTLYLMESGFLGLAGGLFGTFLGIAIGKAVEIAASQMGFEALKAQVGPGLVIGALLFSFIMGTISGFWPARKAARMDPAETLRYE